VPSQPLTLRVCFSRKARFVEAHEWLGLLSGMMTKHAIKWVALQAVVPLEQSFDNHTLLGMVMGKRMVALDGDRRRPPAR
jgi:hypothetical protein